MNLPVLLYPFWSPVEVQSALNAAIEHLNDRKVLAYPTETVYGFGTAVDYASVEMLVQMKGRPPSKPFLLLVSGSEMIERLGLVITPVAASLAARFWPGPLTLVLPGGEKRVSERLRGPNGGIAVRWTPHEGLQSLLSLYGDAITSTSANRPGVAPAESGQEIARQWNDEINRGDMMVLDAGKLPHSEPSTVVDCTTKHAKIVRVGAVSIDSLRECIPDIVL